MRDLQNAGKFAARRKRNHIWRSVVTGIAALVVFCTTYALILPAITMETEGFGCGLEEHSHSEQCLQLTCGMQEYFSHTHTEECYEGETLICPLEERTIHHHSDACYSTAQPECGLTECEAHAHSEDCYGPQAVLICGTEERAPHTHGEDCYTDGALACGLEETDGHTHSDACYEEKKTLLCTLAESEGHTHTEDCYPADFEPELICGEEDIPEHRHSEACCIRICEKEEHTHTDACLKSHEAFLQNQNMINSDPQIDWTDPDSAAEEGYYLICQSQEEGHLHSEDCYLLSEDLVDWADPDSAEAAGYVLLCQEESEEHTHTEDCYAFAASLGQAGGALFTSPSSGGRTTGGTLMGVKAPAAVGVKYDADRDVFSAAVSINFTFPGQASQTAVLANTPYTYTYPQGVVIPVDLLGIKRTLVDKSNTEAGTYEFIKTGDVYSVSVVFSDTYVDQLAIGTDKSVEGYVSYSFEFAGSQLSESGLTFVETNYTLPVSGSIDYPKKNVTESYDISASKSGSWVLEEDKLVYTVYVRTTKGTPDPITLTDVLTAPDGSPLTGLTLGEPNVTIEKGTSWYYTQWNQVNDQNDWHEVSGITPNPQNGTITMSLPKLTAKKATDSGRNPYIEGEVYRITYAYPVTDQTVETIPTKNTVTVTATDSQKGQTITNSAEDSPTISKSMSYTLTKTGQVSSENPNQIKWVVTLNSNKQDLTKAVFTDAMLKQVKNPATDIQISPSDGINVDAANGEITFTAGSNGTNKTPYTITYYTPVERTWDGSKVPNSATLTPDPGKPDDKVEVNYEADVPGVSLGKTGSHNVTTGKLDWTITVNPNGVDIAEAELKDDMFSDLAENDFTISPGDSYEFIRDSENKIIGILFKPVAEGGKNTQSYTITYSTSIPTDASGNQVSEVTNTATLKPGEGKTGKPITVEPKVFVDAPKLNKTGEYNSWNSLIKWTVTVNENGKNIAGAVLTDSMLGQLTSSEINISNGNGQSVPESEYTIHTNTEGKVTDITFQPINNGINSNKYCLIYYTTSLQEWKDKTVQNEAKLTLNGVEIPKTAEVPIYGWGEVAKSAGKATVEGNTMTIPWTVTLKVPKGGLASGTVITDDVTKNQYNNTNTNQWLTPTQITDWITNNGMTWTWKDDQGTSKGTVVFPAAAIAPTGEATVNGVTVYKGFKITLPEAAVPPEGATKLTFTYTTTADISGATTVQTKFYNFVDVDGRTGSGECTYFKPSIQKTDGNWQTGTSTVTSLGNVTWKVKASAGMNNQKMKLVDTLPEGVTLDSLQLTGSNNLNVALTVNEGEISGMDSTNQYTISGSFDNRDITLEILPKTEGANIPNGAEFILTVNCSIPNAETVTGSKELKNDVKLLLDDVEIGSSQQIQNWTYRIVSKTGLWDNNPRLLKYSVVINPDGRDLDKDPNTDMVELEDELRYNPKPWLPYPWSVQIDVNISLNPSSIKLVNTETNAAVTGYSWQYTTKKENSWSDYLLNKLSITIPDNVPLRLDYSYTVSSSAEEGVTFNLDVTNSAALKQTEYGDKYGFGDAAKWEKQTSSAGITSSSSLLTLTKVDADNNGKFLENAEFTIYAYRPGTTEGTASDGWVEVGVEKTDAKGTVTIMQGDASKGQRVYDTNVLYKIKETKAPTNYLIPNPVPEYYFCFSGSETMAVPEGFSRSSAIDLNKIGNSILVKNTKSNNPVYTLPETGGAGTGAFTAAGLALVLGAGVGLVKKRRRGDVD